MNKKFTGFIFTFLILGSLAAFGQIAGNEFINYDDNEYITGNSHIKAGMTTDNIQWAFTNVLSCNWHPLTLLSHMLDWNLFGAKASGHHLVSLLLHIGAVIFLFFFLYKTTNNIWPAAFAAAFFALHPLRVESVAWVAERKDVLSMFFGTACLWAYTFYVETPKPSKYLLCLILFALALMSKPMLVTLPFILMLLDYWPLRRWERAMSAPKEERHKLVSRLIWEKGPFILLTLVSCILTLWAQGKGEAITSSLHFSQRLSNAIVSYVAYLGKTFWPFHLAVFYPYELSLSLWKVIISCIVIVIITLAVLYYIKRLPFLFVGWFWYLGTLVPVIGLVQVGQQSMADRYTYFPSIGISIMLAWSIPFLIKKEEMRKKVLFPAAIVIVIFLSVLTWRQCGYWKNSMDLWSHSLQVTKDNYLAHSVIASVLIDEGKIDEAIEHCNKAIHIEPNYSDAYKVRGNAYNMINQHRLAFENYNEVIRLKSNDQDAYNGKGVVYAKLGQYQQAVEEFNNAIRLKLDFVNAYHNRSKTYLLLGNKESGCSDAQKACELGDCRMMEAVRGKGICR